MSFIKTLEFKLRGGARNRKTLRHRRALGQHAGKIGRSPDAREIDAAVMKAIGIHQSRNQAKRQVIAIHRVRGEQRPTGLKLDGPEAVEFDRGLPFPGKGSIRELGRDMKAQWRVDVPVSRGLEYSRPTKTNRDPP